MRKTMLALTAAALAVPTVPAAPAFAHDGYNGKIWRDSNGRYRCKRPNGNVLSVGELWRGHPAALEVGVALDASVTMHNQRRATAARAPTAPPAFSSAPPAARWSAARSTPRASGPPAPSSAPPPAP